ncbi:hypothetical protein V8C26DRAFT_401039 [Trichoderma gracile]
MICLRSPPRTPLPGSCLLGGAARPFGFHFAGQERRGVSPAIGFWQRCNGSPSRNRGGGAVPEIRRATRGTCHQPAGYPTDAQIPETGIARWQSLEGRNGSFARRALRLIADSQLYQSCGLPLMTSFDTSLENGSHVRGRTEQCAYWPQGLRAAGMELLLASRFL